MSEPLLFDTERDTLRDLTQLLHERAKTEDALNNRYDTAIDAAQRELNKARRTIAANREKQTEAVTASHGKTRAEINERYENEQTEADRKFRETAEQVRHETTEMERKTRAAYQDALWTADSVHEGAEKHAEQQFDTLQRKGKAVAERIESMRQQADPLLARVGLNRDRFAGPVAAGGPVANPADAIEAGFVRAEEKLQRLKRSLIIKMVTRGGFIILFVLAAAAAGGILMSLEEITLEAGIWAGGGALVAAIAGFVLFRILGKKKALRIGSEFEAALADTNHAREALLQQAKAQFDADIKLAAEIRDASRQAAKEKFEPTIERIIERRAQELADAGEKHARATEKLRNWHAKATQQADDHFSRTMDNMNGLLDAELAEAEARYAKTEAAARAERDSAFDALVNKWNEIFERASNSHGQLIGVARERFASWGDPLWQSPPKFDTIPRGARFGTLEVDLAKLPGGLPDNGHFKPLVPARSKWPAYLPFPHHCPLLLKVKDQGRADAVQALQAIMLRFLTGLPPGKVRFTIIDPVGLGDNFAAFMHLADYDEQLVGPRIWTETAQIDKKLSDMTQHMENVIQKYLRNQYKSIEEYNEQAGEVAEPFRVLVIANFPTNFSLDACRRLISIASSGATCGVFTLVSVDMRQPFPQGFNLSDLELPSMVLVGKDGGGFLWKDPVMERFPLTLDAPPETPTMTKLVTVVGERSRDANRVEVPFEFVTPAPSDIWKSSSRKGIVVPIGRAGATKRQMMSLGQGTAQHALIAGKTGSGKSTFLHALITNLALHYSPDEAELYLIDFKKGVEFKMYAAHQLPHARVVAIESEREFGLSVLQKLDAELKERGDRFRDAGVNDVDSFRTARPNEKLPRILLVVDEFQEFFVEDDRHAQEAALLLDRLVRQGRAFGLHVFLGSQTLGGAYSLARATIDQMAVRIALQCSDADAQLILSKENTAARLLSRPGEAIYNDANGLPEGNDLFQVVWLSEHKREQYLDNLRERAASSGKRYPPPLVFEGNTPSFIDQNKLLTNLLEESAWPRNVRVASAWLGEAVAIKDPTAAVFRPQSGNNLLMVGQNEEASRSLFMSSLFSLAAHYEPNAARFIVLDGTNEEDEYWGYLRKMAEVLPHQPKTPERNEIAAALAEIADEVNARQKGESNDRSPRFVMIHGLHRYRDLRKAEDDYGFGRKREGPASPAESFATILREGPAFGVYLLMWCDTLTNLNRTIDRQGLRECGLRVLFQMSANDSSTLIDTPVASRLGRHRALFVSEQSSSTEKFRPYGLPTPEWLNWLRQRLAEKKTSAEPVSAGG